MLGWPIFLTFFRPAVIGVFVSAYLTILIFVRVPALALQYDFSPLPLLHSWLFGRLLCDALGIYWGRSGDALGTLWRRSGIRGDDDDDDDDDDGESSISIYANSRSTALAAGRCYIF